MVTGSVGRSGGDIKVSIKVGKFYLIFDVSGGGCGDFL